MVLLSIRPSDIRFSQNSIGCTFGKNTPHADYSLGETLDDILLGNTTIDRIPMIIVTIVDGIWFTPDNRRLWVFRKLEELGYCEEICVREGYYIPDNKFTTGNEGVSVNVRGPTGGHYWRNYRKKTRKQKRQNRAEKVTPEFQRAPRNGHNAGYNQSISNQGFPYAVQNSETYQHLSNNFGHLSLYNDKATIKEETGPCRMQVDKKAPPQGDNSSWSTSSRNISTSDVPTKPIDRQPGPFKYNPNSVPEQVCKTIGQHQAITVGGHNSFGTEERRHLEHGISTSGRYTDTERLTDTEDSEEDNISGKWYNFCCLCCRG